MGLERKLKERIPEIAEVVQSFPNVPILTTENIETVLDTVRPFLSVAGGKISIVSLTGVGGLQPTVALKMDGTAAALQSVKIEIMQRIQRHFAQSLKIDWVQWINYTTFNSFFALLKIEQSNSFPSAGAVNCS